MTQTIFPTTFEDVLAAVRNHPKLHPLGGGAKPALSTAREGVTPLNLSRLAGIVEYNPSEYTFTALAGTRLAEIQTALDAHGQYLPFDPPLVEQGATLGGAVAAGLSGPGRYRYGGVRDFILGVRFVDGRGQLVSGGGKVVKNAAGFDFPKLMVGSLGQFGALVELTFKVFPQPAAYTTISLPCAKLEAALQTLSNLYTARLEIDCLDFVPLAAGGATLFIRLGGLPPALPARADRIRNLVGGGEVMADESEKLFWREAREFKRCPAGWALVKVPLTPKRIVDLESGLAALQTVRHYSCGGNVAWIATPAPLQQLDALLSSINLSGLVILGPAERVRLGVRNGQPVEARVKQVLDPRGVFPLW